MAKRARSDEEPSMDSLLDALTNVVGILLLILITTSLLISAAVKKVVEDLPEVSEEKLEQMREKVEKTRENLKSLEITQQDNEPLDEEEQKEIIFEIEEIEKNNEDLVEKTSDLDELQKLIEEQESVKEVNVEEVTVASSEIAELKSILDQTPEPEVSDATVVNMPNPRRPDERERANYILCKNKKLYWVGDPYEHTFRVSQVLDQNFAKLAYTGTALGSYTTNFQSTSLNDARTGYESETESVRLGARHVKESPWNNLSSPYYVRRGGEGNFTYESLEPKSVIQRIFGNDDKADFAVAKFRLDLAKVKDFFGDGKFGPKHFKYHVMQNGTGDQLKLQLEPREEGGWPIEEFARSGSEFVDFAKGVQVNRGYFYYLVAPDSFDVYLKARDSSERMGIKAGWTTFTGDKLDLRATPLLETYRYPMDDLPREEYLKIANTAGAALVASYTDAIENFDTQFEAISLDDIEDPTEKAAARAKLETERRDFLTREYATYTFNIFKSALAAVEAKGPTEVRVDVHPPAIPFNRIFLPRSMPKKPAPPKPDRPARPKGPPTPTGGAKLILD